MASFGGHAIPGGFFLLLGFWLTVKHVLLHYWRGNNGKGRPTLPPFFRRMNYGEGGMAVFGSFVGEFSSKTTAPPNAPLAGVTTVVPPQV